MLGYALSLCCATNKKNVIHVSAPIFRNILNELNKKKTKNYNEKNYKNIILIVMLKCVNSQKLLWKSEHALLKISISSNSALRLTIFINFHLYS